MRVFKRPQFLFDLAHELTWLNKRAGAETAERWYQALLATIEELKLHPLLGRERPDLKTKHVRSWRMTRFPRWLVFYQVREDALILLRVRYGTMDFGKLELKG